MGGAERGFRPLTLVDRFPAHLRENGLFAARGTIGGQMTDI